MEKKGKLALGGALLIVLALIVWTVRTIPDAPTQEADAEKPRVMRYDGNVLSEQKNGRMLWDLTADHIEVDIDTQNARLTDLTAHFYQEDGRTAKVKAQEGSYDAATRDIEVRGAVTVSTSDGAALSSDVLKWTAADGKLSAIGSARAEKDDMEATGERIESTDGFNRIKIIGKAHLARGERNETE